MNEGDAGAVAGQTGRHAGCCSVRCMCVCDTGWGNHWRVTGDIIRG